MDFQSEIGTKFPSVEDFMTLDVETIATLYELLAMADGPKLLAGTPDARTPKKIKVFSNTSHE